MKIFFFIALILGSGGLNAKLAYITSSSAYIYVFDTEQSVFLTPIHVGSSTYGIDFTRDGKFIYVTSPTTNEVIAIDLAETTSQVRIPVGNNPQDVTIATVNGNYFAYVVNSQSDSVSVINVKTNGIEATISLNLGIRRYPNAIIVHPNQKYVYVANSGVQDIYQKSYIQTIRTQDNTLLNNNLLLPITSAIYPSTAGFDTDLENNLYLVCNGGNNNSLLLKFSIEDPVNAQLPQYLGQAADNTHRFREITVPDSSLGFISSYLIFPYPNPNSVEVYSYDITSNNPILNGTTTSLSNVFASTGIIHDDDYVYVCATGSLLRYDRMASSPYISSTPLFFSIGQTSEELVKIIIPTVYIPYPPIPPTPPQPPVPSDQPGGKSSFQAKNNFGIDYEWSNVIMWGLSPNYVLGYYIYKNGKRIATVSNSTSSYEDHDVKKGLPIVYSITSFSADGLESAPLEIIVK